MNNVGNFLLNGVAPMKKMQQKTGEKEKVDQTPENFEKKTQEKLKKNKQNESNDVKVDQKENTENIKNVKNKQKTTEKKQIQVSENLKKPVKNEEVVVTVKLPKEFVEELKKDNKEVSLLMEKIEKVLKQKKPIENEKDVSLTLTQGEMTQLLSLLFVHAQDASSPVKTGTPSTESIQLNIQFDFSQKEKGTTTKVEEAQFLKTVQTLKDIAKQLTQLAQQDEHFEETISSTVQKKTPVSLVVSFETANGTKKQDASLPMNTPLTATLVKETIDGKQKNQEQSTNDGGDKKEMISSWVEGLPVLEDKNKSFSVTQPTTVSSIKELKELINQEVNDFVEVKTMGDTKATIRLQQEGLGKLEIQIEKQEGKMMVYIKVADETAQEKVEMVMDSLKNELKEKEINLEYEVEQENKDSERENQQQQEKRKEEQDELKKKHNREMIGNNHDQNFMEFMGGY